MTPDRRQQEWDVLEREIQEALDEAEWFRGRLIEIRSRFRNLRADEDSE